MIGEPKSDAGHRTVTLPAVVAAASEEHLENHVAVAPDALLFSTSSGGYPARSNWHSPFSRPPTPSFNWPRWRNTSGRNGSLH